jgi:hypothetical protein
LLEPSFKELISEDELDFGHMINNRVLGSLLFGGVNSVGIAGRKVRAAVSGDEGKGDRVFRKEVV